MDVHDVDPDTVCQCTGWCDSNKTLIFEKDIVEFVGANTYRDLICWCNEMNMMNAVPLDGIEFINEMGLHGVAFKSEFVSISAFSFIVLCFKM